ncbi:hypothetical protein KZC52_07455 [Microbacterium sp. kSW2-24]|uniref:DUF7882 family protein n=1 Tax=Microbacterium galbinum TaxID=2851646 RepID=UPI001FFDD89E|nr:hypothetical protein [Microbacterium galbinum]MCK2022754.1 hypothetical protein [Microbacterium galbinum]
MGSLYYANEAEPIEIEDRALAHLKIVISTKLRRNESFTLSWVLPERAGRETIWVHPSIPMRFIFDDAVSPKINNRWLQDMMNSANSSGGISLVEETIEVAQPDTVRS